MPRSQKEDPELLGAALIGLQHTLNILETRIAELHHQLGAQASRTIPVGGAAVAAKKRNMSDAARKRIAMAQKKRWAAYNAAKAASKAGPAVASAAAGK